MLVAGDKLQLIRIPGSDYRPAYRYHVAVTTGYIIVNPSSISFRHPTENELFVEAVFQAMSQLSMAEMRGRLGR